MRTSSEVRWQVRWCSRTLENISKHFTRTPTPEHQTGTFLTLPPELVLVHPLHALDSYSYGATILWLLMRVYPKPTAVLVPSVNSFVEKLIGSDSCSRHSSRLVDMSEPNLIGSFVSVRGEFRRMEVVEVLSSGVRLYGRGSLTYDNFAGPGRFIRGTLLEPPLVNIGKQCM